MSLGMLAACGPRDPVVTGEGSGSGDDGQTSTSGHPLGWSCGDGIVVTGEYCFRELRFEGVDVVAVALGDLTGDGRADVVVQTREELRSYAIHDDGTFELLDAWGDGFGPVHNHPFVRLYVGDFDGDGRRDVVRRHSDETALFSQGADGAMADEPHVSVVQPRSPGAPYGVVDVDRDGSEELLVLQREGETNEPLRVTGITHRSGAWSYLALGFEFWFPQDWAFGDIDGDGVVDPAVVMDPYEARAEHPFILDGFDSRSAHLGWLRPDGGGIALGATLAPGFYASEIELGDIDGDGHVDVMLATTESEWEDFNYDDPSPPRVLFWGRGNWDFDGPHDLGDVWGDAIDVEGDGVAELVRGAVRDSYEVLTHSQGTFASTIVSAPLCTRSSAMGDVNADGVLDCANGGGFRSGDPTGSGSLVVVLSDP